MKVCSRCHVSKEETEFYFSNNRPNSWCKQCYRDKAKEYQSKNKDKVLVQRKIYRDCNKEKISIAKKKCFWAKREQYRANAKKYREANKEKIALRNKLYRQKNLDKIKAKTKQRVELFGGYKAIYLKNRDRIKETRKIWYPKNKYKIAAINKKHSLELTENYIKALLRNQGIKTPPKELIEIERIRLLTRRLLTNKNNQLCKQQ